MSTEPEQIYLINSSSQLQDGLQKSIEVPQIAQANLENVEDFSNVCRTCATITEFVIPIFDGEGLQNNLAEKINRHLPIQVSVGDSLPLAVCYQCAHTVLAWHELVACCSQADAALRTASLRHQESRAVAASEAQNLENNPEQREFEDSADRVVPPVSPPQYAGRLQSCEFCQERYPQQVYKEHLITAHSDLLFQCDECNTYVDRKDFILHMSLHAVQYATDNDNKEAVKVKKWVKKDENENTRNEEQDDNKELVPIKLVANEDQENEFSDHSDTEYGFGPLPESVFEAIEDSQDCEELEAEAGPESYGYESNSADLSIEGNKEKKRKKPRSCPICGKVYTAASSYFYHIKYFHKRIKEHECNICGRKFGTKSTLQQHVSIHAGECVYGCDECGKRFRSKASLYIHKQTHIGNKAWACTQCQISFRWRTQLMRHMMRHTADKVHVCSICSRGFTIKCDLLRHARTHTAGNFACEQCGVKFAQIRYLKVHLERKHRPQVAVEASSQA